MSAFFQDLRARFSRMNHITFHIQGIYDEGELLEPATCKDYLQVRQEGQRQVQRSLKHYNLDTRQQSTASRARWPPTRVTDTAKTGTGCYPVSL